MLKRIRVIIAITFIAIFMAMPFMTYGNKWEPMKTERTDAKTVLKESEVEVKTASSIIIVTSSHSVQIKIFTILGRLVSSETLPAGTSSLALPAHGVYLVKIGNTTCKVAV